MSAFVKQLNIPVMVIAFILATNIDWIQESVKAGPVTLFQVLLAILAPIMLVHLSRASTPRVPFAIVMLLSGGVCGLVVIPSLIHDMDEGGMVQVIGYLFRLGIMGTVAIAAKTWKDWEMLAYAALLASALTALAAILTSLFPDAAFAAGAIHIQGHEYTRINGIERDPNYAALKMNMALPFAQFAYMRAGASLKTLFLTGAILVVLCSGVLLTGSRIGLVVMLITMSAWAIFMVGRRWRSETMRIWLMLCVMIVGGLILSPLWGSTLSRMTMKGTSLHDVATAESRDRWAIAADGLAEYLRHPLVGIGPLEEGFHNSYVDILACYGILGMIPFLLILGSVIRRQWQYMRSPSDAGFREVKKRMMAILFSLFAWGVTGVTIGAQRELLLWVVMGLGLARWDVANYVFKPRLSRNLRGLPINPRPTKQLGGFMNRRNQVGQPGIGIFPNRERL